MKIVTWNCNGALRKKAHELDGLAADVLVVQECEDPSQSTSAYRDWAGDYLWNGESKSRGIGIFPRNGNKVSRIQRSRAYSLSGISERNTKATWNTDSLRLFLPFRINDQIDVLAVWTKGSDNEVFGYIGQLWKYLQIHRTELSKGRQIILGDFNSNSVWDKKDRWWNHTNVVEELEEIGLRSLYHVKKGEPQGSESTPTFYMHRKPERPYHIDYVFVSDEYLSSDIAVGEKETWLKLSDHMPIEVSLSS